MALSIGLVLPTAESFPLDRTGGTHRQTCERKRTGTHPFPDCMNSLSRACTEVVGLTPLKQLGQFLKSPYPDTTIWR